jgi:hypothetical protein
MMGWCNMELNTINSLGERSFAVKDIVDEVIGDYKKTSMYIATTSCDWKCCIRRGFDKSICQNSHIAKKDNIYLSIESIYNRYINNGLTHAIVVGGLEPFLQFDELDKLIMYFRLKGCKDEFVIYTGYREDSMFIHNKIKRLKCYENIIVKFGEFVPYAKHRFDEVLGVELISDNQYAVKIS